MILSANKIQHLANNTFVSKRFNFGVYQTAALDLKDVSCPGNQQILFTEFYHTFLYFPQESCLTADTACKPALPCVLNNGLKVKACAPQPDSSQHSVQNLRFHMRTWSYSKGWLSTIVLQPIWTFPEVESMQLYIARTFHYEFT